MKELIKLFIAAAFVFGSYFVGESMGAKAQSEVTAKVQAKLRLTERSVGSLKKENNALKRKLHDCEVRKQILPAVIKPKGSRDRLK